MRSGWIQVWVKITVISLMFAIANRGRGADMADAIPIGIVSSLFQDDRLQKQGILVEPFQRLVRLQTGLPCAVEFSEDYMHLGQDLTDGKLTLGVFQGIEFAWARERYPELKPLLVIVNQLPFQQAQLVIRADSAAKGFPDLRGKKLAMARSTRVHQSLYLDRACHAGGRCKPENYFDKLARPTSAEDGLDDLVDGVHDAMVADRVAWESYQRRKPARAQRLKVLHSSEVFPATAVAYVPGRLSQERLKQFEEGMLRADKNIVGRQLLSLWYVSGFAPVPAEYEKTLVDIKKTYESPAASASAKPIAERTK